MYDLLFDGFGPIFGIPAVLGTRGHILVVNRMLRSIKRRAELSVNGH